MHGVEVYRTGIVELSNAYTDQERGYCLPAAILADLLGFDQGIAEDWTQLANTDWARYAAAR